jgi:NAD(P)-dependent dehydrogenase (short-subunit alcohol dehydrogenase family)
VARNIRVNAVNPGLVKTEGMAGFANGHFEKGAVAATPLFI